MSETTTKLSPQLNLLLQSENEEAVVTDKIFVLLSVGGTLSNEQHARLQSKEVEIGTIAGDIVSGVVPLQAISSVAALDFVRYIELSSPLFPES